MFVPNLNNFRQGVPEIPCSQQWDGWMDNSKRAYGHGYHRCRGLKMTYETITLNLNGDGNFEFALFSVKTKLWIHLCHLCLTYSQHVFSENNDENEQSQMRK